MLFLPSYLKESQKKMSEKHTGKLDAGDAYTKSKQEEAQNPPMYPGAGPAQMPPPPSYPGYQVPPGQPGMVYHQQTAPLMYGQPNVVVQYPGGAPGVMAGGQPLPPDHFMMALMVTLFCFCPTGFIALMRASDARTAVARGDLQSATMYSREAKRFINISIGVGILSVILTVVLMVLYFTMLMGMYH